MGWFGAELPIPIPVAPLADALPLEEEGAIEKATGK